MIKTGNKSFMFKCVHFMEMCDVFILSRWPKEIFQIVSSLLSFQFNILKYHLKVWSKTSIITIPCTLNTDVMGLYFLNYKIYMSQKTYMSWTLGLTDKLISKWASCCHGPCLITAVIVQFLCIFFKVPIPNPFIYLVELGQGHIKNHRIGKNIVSNDLWK